MQQRLLESHPSRMLIEVEIKIKRQVTLLSS